MSYDKQTWQRGDVITANKLNHMEDGIAGGGGVFIVNITENDETLIADKTYSQITHAISNGETCIATYQLALGQMTFDLETETVGVALMSISGVTLRGIYIEISSEDVIGKEEESYILTLM